MFLTSDLSFLEKIDFRFDERLKKGYFSTDYFLKTTRLLKQTKPNQTVVMQFVSFNEDPIMVCGVTEVKKLLEFCLSPEQLASLSVYAVPDGTILSDKHKVIMRIEGNYLDFGIYENIMDGILARRSSVATNCMNALNALKDHQQIIYMADRSCDYFNQSYDGYAAYVAGIRRFVTQAQVSLFQDLVDHNWQVVGTMPHALIQQYGGNLNQVIVDYDHYLHQLPLALIDYHNNVISELESIQDHLNLINGVRIDTPKNMIDASLFKEGYLLSGVNPILVKTVREWLNDHQASHLKIVVSSGFDDRMIRYFNDEQAPVDWFGIGHNLIKNSVNITADLVNLNGQPEAKMGRYQFPVDKTFVKII